MRTAGFVLVGGRSSRMGQDKALLPWRNETVVQNIAAKVKDAAGSVAVIGRAELEGFAADDCLADLRPGLGPLAGIETALTSSRGELNLIVACDLPQVETEWLNNLIQHAKTRQRKCVIAKDAEGRVHPVCGVYRKDCLPAIQNALDAGRLKLMEIVEELGAEHVTVPAPLWNVNTPEDWQHCMEFANGR
jgi:molybdopterin-guanine dinucleotide biosynthesis protein A